MTVTSCAIPSPENARAYRLPSDPELGTALQESGTASTAKPAPTEQSIHVSGVVLAFAAEAFEDIAHDQIRERLLALSEAWLKEGTR